MKPKTVKNGMTVCGVMIAAAIIGIFTVSGDNAAKAQITLAAFLLWMAHGLYRGYRHVKAQKPLSCNAGPQEDAIYLPPPTTTQVINAFFNPQGMHFRTSGSIFLLAFAAIFGLHTALFGLFTLVILLKAWFLCKYMRLAKTMRENCIYTEISNTGVAWRMKKDISFLKGPFVKKSPWHDVYEIIGYERYALIRTSTGDEYLFRFTSPENKKQFYRIASDNFMKSPDKSIRRQSSPNAGMTVPEEYKKAMRIASEIKQRTTVPCYRLEINSERKPKLTDTKLGGLPYWDKSKKYPTGEKGEKMMLLAQINFFDNHMNAPLPQSGILQFFITDDYSYGCNWEHLDNQKNFRVVYHANIDPHVTREQVEAMKLPVCENSEYRPLCREVALDIRPSASNSVPGILGFSDAFRQAINDLYGEQSSLKEYFVHDENEHAFSKAFCNNKEQIQMLGYPTFIRHDPRRVEDDYRHYDTLLLQIPSTGTDTKNGSITMWDNCGVANFFINHEDLAQLDFSHILYTWNSISPGKSKHHSR